MSLSNTLGAESARRRLHGLRLPDKCFEALELASDSALRSVWILAALAIRNGSLAENSS